MKYLRLGLILVPLAVLVLLNVRLHSPGGAETVAAQLRYLDRALSEGAAERMQTQFPEGFVFTWTLYGLASAQLARQLELHDERRPHLIAQTRRALDEVRSPKGRGTFDPELTPPYGAFYRSWSLYLFAEYVRTVGREAVDPAMLQRFTAECDSFAVAISQSVTPFLESYRQQVWPADMPPGVAALGIHDAVVSQRYRDVVRRWVVAARSRIDPSLGVLPHGAHPLSGRPSAGARGSSLALMSRILIDVDEEFAREQYAALRKHFLDAALGVPGMREYPHGVDGAGDVDSGPIIFGFSGPAIVVGAAAARVHGDDDVADALLGAVELVGMPVEFSDERSYAGGAYPVGDAFIAWARSSSVSRADTQQWPTVPYTWFIPFHVLSIAFGALLVWWGYRIVRPAVNPQKEGEGTGQLV